MAEVVHMYMYIVSGIHIQPVICGNISFYSNSVDGDQFYCKLQTSEKGKRDTNTMCIWTHTHACMCIC